MSLKIDPRITSPTKYRIIASAIDTVEGEATGDVYWKDIVDKPETFPPTVGTGPNDAKPGNYKPSWEEITSKPPVIASGSTEEDARESVGAMAASARGEHGGVAPLDLSGKVPLEYLNVSGLTPLGVWDAETNTPELVDGLGENGDFYKSSSNGTQTFGGDSLTFGVGDWVIYAGGVWNKISAHEAVMSVNGMLGNVVLKASDVGARPDNWMPNADQVGALPSSYKPHWSDIEGIPDLPTYKQRGEISPPIPALYLLAGDQTIPINSIVDFSTWTTSGYDQFGMRSDGATFAIPDWATHVRVTTSLGSDHIKSSNVSHLWASISLNNKDIASSQCMGTDTRSYPVVTVTTPILPISKGDSVKVRVWHNDDTPKLIKQGTKSWISIELFEKI